MTNEKKNVLIVEDHPMVAEAMGGLLSKIDSDLNVVISGCAQHAIAEFHRAQSWFRIFIDLDIPGAHGLSLPRQFANWGVANRCAVITAFDKLLWRTEIKSMGMLAYIVKASSLENFASSITAVIKGETTFPPCAPGQSDAPSHLTRRQQDVLYLLQRGYTSKEIARQLHLNTGTVHNHVSSLLQALHVSSRTHAVAKAIELGYLKMADL